MKKLIAVLTLAMTTTALAPNPMAAQAADCTRDYVGCMNDSWDMSGWLQKMADIECFSEYVGCVAKSIVKR